ncbi:MAG: right-handed parallel beta-helix repeat-containing protein [Candidatus Bipolaricaulis sp.]|nr:right-handed parallel beta-helix repeat-containing protein [Candidatus Bipolaricaulis sp.]
MKKWLAISLILLLAALSCIPLACDTGTSVPGDAVIDGEPATSLEGATIIDTTNNRNIGDATTPVVAKVYSADYLAAMGWSITTDEGSLIWVCDGTADEVEINAAIDAMATAGGGTVQLIGTFTVAGDVVCVAGVDLIGMGDSTILHCNGAGVNVLIADCSNVTVRDFRITGTGLNAGNVMVRATTAAPSQLQRNVVVENILASATPGPSFYITSSGTVETPVAQSGITFRNLRSLEPDGSGIIIYSNNTTNTDSISDVLIEGCVVYKAGFAATRVNDFVGGIALCEGLDGAHGGPAITNITVRHNTVSYCWESGVHIEKAPTKVGVVIENNRSSYNGQKPVPIYGAGYAISGDTHLNSNYSYGNATYGYLIRAGVYLDNCYDEESGISFRLLGSGTVLSRCVSVNADAAALLAASGVAETITGLDIDLKAVNPGGSTIGSETGGMFIGVSGYPVSDSKIHINYSGDVAYAVVNHGHSDGNDYSGTITIPAGSTNAVYGIWTNLADYLSIHDLQVRSYAHLTHGLYLYNWSRVNTFRISNCVFEDFQTVPTLLFGVYNAHSTAKPWLTNCKTINYVNTSATPHFACRGDHYGEVSFPYDSALFNAADTTDSATVVVLPAASVLYHLQMRGVTQFDSVDDAVTDLDITIGNAGDPDGIMVLAMNLITDTVLYEYVTRGALWNTVSALYNSAQNTIAAYATATGANLDTLTAGRVEFIIQYVAHF